jgi:hypothetical protein
MSLKNGKLKRYNVSLTPANVEKFHAILKRYGQGKVMMSTVLDETLRSMNEAIESLEMSFAETGKLPTLPDLLTALSSAMDNSKSL